MNLEDMMVFKKPEREWEKFGSKEPFYGGGINKERFKKGKIDEKSLKEFFASGEKHMEFILDTIHKVFHTEFLPSRFLDFGCGVGRCAIPMAKSCQEVVGVDVSEGVIKEARKISTSHSLHNIDFYKSDGNLSHVPGKFDLIHSSFVFQHIPPGRGLKIFQGLIERLSENGFAAVDFLIHRNVSTPLRLLGTMRKWVPGSHHMANLLEGKPFSEPYAEKNVYPLNRVMKTLHENQCGNTHVSLFRNGNHLDAILFFEKKRDIVPHELFVADSPRGDT